MMKHNFLKGAPSRKSSDQFYVCGWARGSGRFSIGLPVAGLSRAVRCDRVTIHRPQKGPKDGTEFWGINAQIPGANTFIF